MIYRITWLVLRFVFRLFLRWRILDADRVPRTGGVILASNHISNLDPPVVGVGVWRRCTYMAKEELFTNRFFAWFIDKLYAFPVKRGTADRASLKHSLDLLEAGWALVMFPEGTRSESGELQEAEMGIGMIAYRSGVPVVPAYVSGTNRVLPKGGGVKLAQICVRYGAPLQFQAPEGSRPGRAEYEDAARQIMEAIRSLRDEDRAEAPHA